MGYHANARHHGHATGRRSSFHSWRVTLTAVGRDFERKVRDLLDELDSTLLGIRGVAATRMGEVSVACVPSTVYYYLSQVIRRYHERCPKVRVKVFDASANDAASGENGRWSGW